MKYKDILMCFSRSPESWDKIMATYDKYMTNIRQIYNMKDRDILMCFSRLPESWDKADGAERLPPQWLRVLLPLFGQIL